MNTIYLQIFFFNRNDKILNKTNDKIKYNRYSDDILHFIWMSIERLDRNLHVNRMENKHLLGARHANVYMNFESLVQLRVKIKLTNENPISRNNLLFLISVYSKQFYSQSKFSFETLFLR